MNNNIVLAYVVNILPRLILVFVSLVLLYKAYIRIRSKYHATVNCWFCNENSKVPYLESNSWTCTKCEQYNGFSKDGGYNREIVQQFDCNISPKKSLVSSYWQPETTHGNGFCNACNEAQRLKIEKLAQFEPKWESRFDEELKTYRSQLEGQYRLCETCDRHLKSVLRDKKKMVLGSKFLEYIVKGAKAIKQPQYNLLRQARQELWKRRLSLVITALTVVNLFCLFGSLPELSRSWFTGVFGMSLGTQLFIGCSHIVAFWRVMTTSFSQNDIIIRLGLFTRTIFMMLLYSLGLRLPQLVRLNFLSLYMLAAPFCILASTFSYNVLDRFRITRYTLLLVLWCIYAGGLIENSLMPTQQVLMFLTSVFTCFLTFTTKLQNTSKLYDDTANSFHKIYSDDLSDGDTITSSYLSQQLDCSSVSARSDISRSFVSMQRSPLQTYGMKSPVTSSTFSLNLPPQPLQNPYEKTSPLSSSMLSLNLTAKTAQEPTLNTSFKSCYSNNNKSKLRSRFGNSVYSFASPAKNPFMSSNINLNGSTRVDHNANNSLCNASFSDLPSIRKLTNNVFQPEIAAPSPRSPFAAASKPLHNLERPSRILSPTRFSFNTMTTGFVTNSNNGISHHDSFNQCKQSAAMNNSHLNCTLDRRKGLGSLYAIDEDFSRASSRSSGFESQSGHIINTSRENSCCPETNDLNRRSPAPDNLRQCQAIDGSSCGLNNTLTIQKPLLSPLTTYTQPLSVNCSSEWNTSNRNYPLSRNSFNLRRYNQNIPSFKRGDLLKKWKEGEAMS